MENWKEEEDSSSELGDGFLGNGPLKGDDMDASFGGFTGEGTELIDEEMKELDLEEEMSESDSSDDPATNTISVSEEGKENHIDDE